MSASTHAALLREVLAAAESVWQACCAEVPDLGVEVVEQLPSTNTALMERVRAGDHHPALLVALAQTAGRGRQGRGWHAEPGRSLTLSLAWPFARATPGALSGLSLAAGAAVAAALHPDVRLKWPNDLCVIDAQGAPAKLGGILIETAPAPQGMVAVIGVGVNVHAPDARALQTQGPRRALPPAGLAARWPEATVARAFSRVAPALCAALVRFEREGFAACRGSFEALDFLRGRTVDVLDVDGRTCWSGTAAGVDASGALIVHTAQGPRTVSAGEVSIRLPSTGVGS